MESKEIYFFEISLEVQWKEEFYFCNVEWKVYFKIIILNFFLESKENEVESKKYILFKVRIFNFGKWKVRKYIFESRLENRAESWLERRLES